MTTTKSTLTDRYVWAVLRSLPEAQRADIEKELRASIADAIDARVENGESDADAERAVLLELGEPARLAAGYAGRPLALIGPALYVDYVRLLKLLLVIVLPSAALGLGVANALGGADIGEIIGSTVVTLISVGVHLAFWVTLVFVILERTGARTPLTPFDLSMLPVLPTKDTPKLSELVGTVIFTLFTVAAIYWQQMFSVFDDADGQPIPLLDAGLWPFWVPVFIGLAVLTLLHGLWLFRAGRWTVPLLAGAVVLNVATAAVLIWLLATGQLLNPAYFAEFGWAGVVAAPDGIGTVGAMLGIAAIAIGSIADAAMKTRRSLRAEG
jgi:hypothetical protein